MKFLLIILCLATTSAACNKKKEQDSDKNKNTVVTADISGIYMLSDGSEDILINMNDRGEYRITKIVSIGENEGFSVAYLDQDKAAAIVDISIGSYTIEGDNVTLSVPKDSVCKSDLIRKNPITMNISQMGLILPAETTLELNGVNKQTMLSFAKRNPINNAKSLNISDEERADVRTFKDDSNIAIFAGCIGRNQASGEYSFRANMRPKNAH